MGYGVAKNTISSTKTYHKDEFEEGKHFVKAVGNSDTLVRETKNVQPHQIYWTKAGVIRLGFFIKSERAKMFRDWVESIVLTVTAPAVQLPKAKRGNHARITPAKMIELLAEIAKIDDKELRLSIVAKLLPNTEVPSVQMQLPLGEKGGQNGR
jgi:hypothetical protein